jgi:hypothetical protein
MDGIACSTGVKYRGLRRVGLRISTAIFACGICLSVGLAEGVQLERARALWNDAAIGSYEYAYNKFCECHPVDPPETLVTVESEAIVNVRHRRAGFAREVPAEQQNLEYYWTIADLFDLIESAMTREATVRAEFDEALGYPKSLFIDYKEDLIGDEIDLRITSFVAVTR